MSEIIIERINYIFQQCGSILPSIDEINQFENDLKELNYLTFGKSSIDIISEKTRSFKGANANDDVLESEKENTQMNNLRAKIKDLENQLQNSETKYEKELEKKRIIEDKMRELSTDRDVILAYKLGTLSELSYHKKIKFGFFLDKSTMNYKTFPFDIEEDSDQQVEDRWALLKSFINSADKQSKDV